MSPTTTHWKRRIGVSLMAAALAAGTAFVGGAPAGAQEAEQPPEDAQEAEVTKSGFYDAPLSNVFPPSVLQQFPPQVVCLLQPKPCTGDFHEDQPDGTKDNYNEVTGGAQEGTSTARSNDPNEPASPHIPEDTLPVSITTGQPRYRSAVAFELPTLPSGHEVDDFTLYLTQTDPTGGVSSPVARQAILALMTCARECQQDQFEKILFMGCEGQKTEDPGTCPAEQSPLNIEMCPIVDDPATEDRNAEWQGERSQDPEAVPETNCFLGANGRLLDDGVTWEFDLTFAMDAWASGDVANNGVLIAPQGAPNFAFGDPDSTFNKQVTFAQDLRFTVASSEPPEPVSFPSGGSSNGTSSLGGSTGGSGGFSAPSASGSNGTVSSFSGPADDGAGAPPAEPAPEVAAGEGAPAEQTATAPVAAGPQEEPSAWYVWLLAPVFLGGLWLTTQALTAPAPTMITREGAMTRLIQQQQAAAAATSGPQLA